MNKVCISVIYVHRIIIKYRSVLILQGTYPLPQDLRDQMVIRSRQVLNGPAFEKNSHGYACPTKQQVPTITSDLCIAPVICIRDLLITFAGGSHHSEAFYFYLYAYSMSSPCAAPGSCVTL